MRSLNSSASFPGCVKCWGQNLYRQLGNSNRTQHIIDCLDGTDDDPVLNTARWRGCTEYNRIAEPQPTECIEFPDNFVAIDIEAYRRSTCALGDVDNTVICWVRCSSFSHLQLQLYMFFLCFLMLHQLL